MKCEYCGSELGLNAKFCTGCGAPVPQQPVYSQPQQPVYQQPQAPVYQQPVYAQPYVPAAPRDLSWKEFYKQYLSKGSKSYVTWMVVICFFTAVLSIGIGVILESPLSVMDVGVYLLMGILLLSTKHWLFALLPTIYSCTFMIVGMANGDTPSGIVAAVVGVKCILILTKAGKAYKKYKAEGIVPANPI